MQNNINNSDKFSEQVRQKLEFHQTAIDNGMWEELSAKLVAPKKKKRSIIIWWSTTGMAAAVALMLLLNPGIFQTEKTNLAKSSENSQTIKAGDQQNKSDIKTPTPQDIAFVNNNSSSIKTSGQNKSSLPTRNNNSKITIQKFDTVINVHFVDNSTNLALNNNETAQNEAIATKSERETESATDSLKIKTQPKLNLIQEEWSDPLKKDQQNKWEMIAMAGSNSSTSPLSSNQQEMLEFFSADQGITSKLSRPASLMSPSNFDTKNYFAPLTVGVAIGYRLSEKFSIESGLNYSYLLSTFSNSYSDARMHLHYLGLPVRLNYTYATKNKWNFYITGGGMVEKGLWQVYVQNQHSQFQTFTTRINDKIDGFQWSLQASTGVGYSVFKNASIYFEPKFMWYFDNDQPVSIRTESKLSIGFEAGLRYNFKNQ